jgi:hypothetical protein
MKRTLSSCGKTVWRLLQGRPWLLALVLTAPIPILEGLTHLFSWWAHPFWPPIPNPVSGWLQAALLFAAGGLARERFRQAAVMGVVGILTMLLIDLYGRINHGLPFPYGWLVDNSLWFAVLIYSDLALQRRWRAMGWGVLTVFVAAALMTSISTWSWLEIWRLSYEGASTGVMNVLHDPLLGVIGWSAVGAAVALSRRPAILRRITAVTIAAATALFVAVAPTAIIHPLAERSVEGEGPFPQYIGTVVLTWRGEERDIEKLWQLLIDGPWPAPGIIDESLHPDREYLIECLRYSMGDEALAVRIANRLLEQPSGELARISASLLAEQSRYEIAHILFRFGMRRGSTVEALEAMKLPCAAYVLLHDNEYDIQFGPEALNYRLSLEKQDRLRALLGRVAGENPRDWLDIYFEVAESKDTPLTESQRQQIAQLIEAFNDFWWAEARLNDIAYHHVVSSFPKEDQSRPFEELHAKYGDEFLTLFQTQRKKIEPSEPDWDAPTTERLVDDMTRYADQVEKLWGELIESLPD